MNEIFVPFAHFSLVLLLFFSLIHMSSFYIIINHCLWYESHVFSLWFCVALIMVSFPHRNLHALLLLGSKDIQNGTCASDHQLVPPGIYGILCSILRVDSTLGPQAHHRVQAPRVVRRLCQLQPHHPVHEEAADWGRPRLRGVHHQQVAASPRPGQSPLRPPVASL